MARLPRLLSLTAALICLSAGPALATDGPAGSDPAQNFPVITLPLACDQPTSAACLNLSVGFLNQARASLGQPPYVLPANFDSLSPGVQAFVLTNLDRVLYGLPPITGITAALSQDAMGGVRGDTDPQPTDTTFNYWTANWAGGFGNVVLAYEAWMFDDGLGSGNLDCTLHHSSGCWGHRHDILWSFGTGSGALAAGVASANDPNGDPGYAMLLGKGDAGTYHPTYTYTWAQAVAAGAGGSSSGSASGTGAGSGTAAGAGAATGAGAAAGSGTGAGSGAGTNPNSSSGSTPPPLATRKVTVGVRLHGAGEIVDQGGQSCDTATCLFTELPGHAIRLTAHAGSHTTFAGWTGACKGVRTTCTLTPGASAATVSAAFAGKARLSRRTSAPSRAHASSFRSRRRTIHAAVTVRGGRIVVRITAATHVGLQCSLSVKTGARFAPDHFHVCWNTTIYTTVPHGVYRLRVRTVSGAVTTYVRSR